MVRSPRRSGFTLVELLLAVTITVILAALMLSVTGSTLKLWQRAQDTFTSETEAKLALDLMERDLQAALFRETGETWLAVDVISTASALNPHGWRTSGVLKPATTESWNPLPPPVDGVPSTVAEARFGLSGAWLRFVTTNVEAKSSGNPGGSLPIIVSYQLARRPLTGSVASTNLAPVRYTLFRSAVANGTSFSAGYHVVAAAYGSSTSSFPAARSARSLTNPNTADAIASNVVDLGVWLYRRDSTGELQRIFPSTESDTTHAAATGAEFPEVADVMVRVLTEEGAKSVNAIESGSGAFTRAAGQTDAQWWWSVVESQSRVYVRRIQLKGGLP